MTARRSLQACLALGLRWRWCEYRRPLQHLAQRSCRSGSVVDTPAGCQESWCGPKPAIRALRQAALGGTGLRRCPPRPAVSDGSVSVASPRSEIERPSRGDAVGVFARLPDPALSPRAVPDSGDPFSAAPLEGRHHASALGHAPPRTEWIHTTAGLMSSSQVRPSVVRACSGSGSMCGPAPPRQRDVRHRAPAPSPGGVRPPVPTPRPSPGCYSGQALGGRSSHSGPTLRWRAFVAGSGFQNARRTSLDAKRGPSISHGDRHTRGSSRQWKFNQVVDKIPPDAYIQLNG